MSLKNKDITTPQVCRYTALWIQQNCSFMVKCTLFRSYCLSLYDIALWQKYTVTCINKLRSSYNKCIKLFFGYHRRDSLIQVFIDTGLPSFDTVMHNSVLKTRRLL